MWCTRSATDGSVTASTTNAAIPSGMLMKKIQRHERWVVKKPPISGPATLEMPKTAPKMPW